MSKDDQSALIMGLFVFLFISFFFSTIGAFGKAWHAFYHQVIIGDEVVGQVHQR
jgi:hypothetical protein